MDGWVGVVHPEVAEVGVIEEAHEVEEATQVSKKVKWQKIPFSAIIVISNSKCFAFRLQ